MLYELLLTADHHMLTKL